MKICVISSTVFPCPPPGYAGLEMIAWQCADGLARRGHEVTLIAPKGSDYPHNGQTIFNGDPGGWDEKTAYSHYWQHLPGHDVVIDHSWQKWSYVLKAEGVLKAPVLGVMHAPVNTMYQTLPPVDFPCMVCISVDQANHFDALHGRVARVVYNGVDPEFYKPLGIPRTKRFLFLARFSSIKGADLAIEACKQAGVGLDLIGDTSITQEPEYFQQCRAYAEQINLTRPPETHIKIHGACSRGEAVWWYSQAHCMLHPNQRFREPFGLAPVESQLCGCPVISWDYGACRETVGASWRVQTLDQMVGLVNDVKNRDIQHSLVRDNALRFSVENMVAGYEQRCQEAVSGDLW